MKKTIKLINLIFNAMLKIIGGAMIIKGLITGGPFNINCWWLIVIGVFLIAGGVKFGNEDGEDI